MRVDRTWTISFDEREQECLKAEVALLDLPTDWGRPLTLRIIGAEQITLPARAIERIIAEIDFTRANFLASRHSRLEYRRQYPTIDALYEKLSAIIDSPNRRSA